MIIHEPSLVILSTTIAIFGTFTAAVMTSDISGLDRGEGRMRIVMAFVALGGSLWAMQFVGLIAIERPINLAYNPVILALSAFSALFGAGATLLLLWRNRSAMHSRLPAAATLFGGAIAATNYLGIGALTGKGLQLSWFLTLVDVAVSFQIALIILQFLFRRRSVSLTLAGAIALGLCIAATHYLAIASTEGLELTLLGIPPDTSGVSGRYLAWSATIMIYLLCSICLSVFVIMQFREDAE